MPGRKGLRGGRGRGGDEEGNREDEKPKSVFATFWANASYKSFAKPHFREAVTDDLEAEGAFPTDRRPGGHHRSAHHGHHPYDSDSNRTPSLSHHHSSSSSTGGGGDGGDGGSHETLTVLPVVANASELERGGGGGGGPPNAPLSPRSLRIPDKRTPSAKFTTHQLLYVFGSHGVGAFIISGGINLAVAYGEFVLSLCNKSHRTTVSCAAWFLRVCFSCSLEVLLPFLDHPYWWSWRNRMVEGHLQS